MTSLELPLLRRELLGLLRAKKAFWMVITVLFLSSLIPLLQWPRGERSALSAEGNLVLLAAFFLAQLATAILLVPAFTAGAIAGERERDTYETLFSTLLRPTSIILSKVAASTIYIAVVLACSSPAVFVLYFLGGTELVTILRCYAVLFGALVFSSLVSIDASMRSERTAQAAVRGYIWVLFWNAWPVVATMLRSDSRLPAATTLSGWLACAATAASPFAAVLSEMFGSWPWGTRLDPSGALSQPWKLCLGSTGLFSLFYAWRLLRAVSLRHAPARAIAPARAPGGGTAEPGAIRRPALTTWLLKSGSTILPFLHPILRNPVFGKEILSEFYGRLGYRRGLFWGSLGAFAVLSFALAILSPFSGSKPNAVLSIGIVSVTLCLILVPAVAATSFAREVEQGNLDFLRGTRLTFAQVFYGKLWGSVYSAWGVISAAFWVLLGLGLLELASRGRGWLLWQGCVVTLVVTATHLFTAALAVTASTLLRRSLGALVLSYAILLGILAAWPVAYHLLRGEYGRKRDLLLRLTHPYVAMFRAIDEGAWGSGMFDGVLFAVFTSAAAWLLCALASRRWSRTADRDR